MASTYRLEEPERKESERWGLDDLPVVGVVLMARMAAALCGCRKML